MTNAYIICPDICFDCLSESDRDNTTYSRLFLNELMNEKERICTMESKKYIGFLAPYHWDKIVEIILYMISSETKELTDDEINLIQLVLKSVERDGIEDYPYNDRYTPILDLAEDKYDRYDIIIVCNNPTMTLKLKEIMRNENNHFRQHIIMTSKEALFNIPKE